MTVLVAGTASSGPAPRSMTLPAASASGLEGSLVMAMVRAPAARRTATTSTISEVAPDWLTPTTRTPR